MRHGPKNKTLKGPLGAPDISLITNLATIGWRANLPNNMDFCSPFHLKYTHTYLYIYISAYRMCPATFPVCSNSKSGKDLRTLSDQWYSLKHAEDSFQASDNRLPWRIYVEDMGPGWPPAVPAHFGYKGIAQYHRPDRFMARNGAGTWTMRLQKMSSTVYRIYIYIFIYLFIYLYLFIIIVYTYIYIVIHFEHMSHGMQISKYMQI